MRTKSPSSRTRAICQRIIVAGALSCIAACVKEDEDLQRQLVETRAALDAKTKALEQAQSAPRPEPPAAPAASSEELAKAKSRISELEQQLAAAQKTAAAAPAAPVAPATPPGQKLDIEVLKDKLEEDLANKAKKLRESVLKQTGVARIDEIGIRGIEYPPEIIAPFRSAITFALPGPGGRQLRLVFPVVADLGGSWSLPGPDKIQQAYKQVQEAPPPEQNVAANPPSAPSTSSTLSAATGSGLNPSSNATPARSSGFRQIEPNTFQFDWGDGTRGAANNLSASRGGIQTSPTVLPTLPGAAPATSSAAPVRQPAAPSAPVQPTMNIPPPVMPVQRDIIIRF